jgi:DNA modification methylase
MSKKTRGARVRHFVESNSQPDAGPAPNEPKPALSMTELPICSTPPEVPYIVEQLRPLAVRCEELVLDPRNARRHPEANLEAIKASLRVYGQRKPIVVNRLSGAIEAGNGTWQAARSLGWSHVAVVYVNDDPMTAAGFSIADNRTAELAEWDREVLEALVAEIKTSDPVLDQMLADLGNSFGRPKKDRRCDPDEVPAAPDEATTRRGDLWLLGDHRLLCGDSSQAEDVDRLLDGSQVHLVHTDPPCNVRAEPRANNGIAAASSSFEVTRHQKRDVVRHPEKARASGGKPRAKDRPPANDFVSEAEFERMLHAWFGNLARALLPGRSFYIWGGGSHIATYPAALQACGLHFSQTIIRLKEHPVLTRKDFLGNHEWCFYGWREGAAHVFLGPNNAVDVWSIKPVELAARALEYSSRPGENVLDLFGGSGSTLVAAEQTGRRAFVMELDELHCDVVVRRWQNLSGRQAKRQPQR